jgi:metal-responsive CopG/Arc/MetJ family transcriptional regulator
MCQMRQIHPPKNNKDTESLVHLTACYSIIIVVRGDAQIIRAMVEALKGNEQISEAKVTVL